VGKTTTTTIVILVSCVELWRARKLAAGRLATPTDKDEGRSDLVNGDVCNFDVGFGRLASCLDKKGVDKEGSETETRGKRDTSRNDSPYQLSSSSLIWLPF
jgi:hypothetical protein